MPAKDNQETAKATRRALLNEYLDEVSAITAPSNIFEFWRERRREFPALFTLSTHTLCVPASSTSVKRIFSANGLIMRPQRARLSSEMLEILVYLKCNSNFLKNKKISLTWCYGFIFKRPNDFRSRSWSRLLLVSVSNQRSRKIAGLGLEKIIRSWSRSRWSRLQHWLQVIACIMFCVRILKIIHTVQLIFALFTVFLFSVMLIANNNNQEKDKNFSLGPNNSLLKWVPKKLNWKVKKITKLHKYFEFLCI